MSDFATHMRTLAQEFIGTVLFIDDQIVGSSSIDSTSAKSIEDTSTVTASAENDTLEDAVSDAETLQVPGEVNTHATVGDNSKNSVEAGSVADHFLRIRALSTSFTSNDILCSPVHTEPISTEDKQAVFVNKVCKLAAKADVIVLDWQMEDKASSLIMGTTAQAIIDKLQSCNPDRDILVCIFSAEEESKVNLDDLSRENVKVFYASKKDANAYEELPNKIFYEFAERHSGLLPAAALSAIKVIRDNSHRILSLYTAKHDPAYLSHRCLLPRPEDAEVFATELMAATFEDLMRGNEAITKYLCCDVLKSWVDLKCKDLPNRELSIKKLDVIQIDNEKRKQWIETGITKWMHCNLNVGAESGKTDAINKWAKDTAKSLGVYFSSDVRTESEFARQAAFAKLTSHAFGDAVNNNASTFLSLGSILKNDKNEYFMCIQPLCDSVRLDNGTVRKFIFIKLVKKEFVLADENKKGFNIIVADGENGDIYLKVSEDISTLDVFWFSPSPGNDKVIMKIGELVYGKQNETTDTSFTFLAQLRSSQAQRIAMRFLNKVTRIGLDESEWLRRHGTA